MSNRTLAMILALLAYPQVGQAQTTRPQQQGGAGRYQFFPATNDMPAVVFDTHTGCVEFIDKYSVDTTFKDSDGITHPNRDSTRFVWVRKQEDQVLKGTPKRCTPEPAA